jgi:hypothetical protein
MHDPDKVAVVTIPVSKVNVMRALNAPSLRVTF